MKPSPSESTRSTPAINTSGRRSSTSSRASSPLVARPTTSIPNPATSVSIASNQSGCLSRSTADFSFVPLIERAASRSLVCTTHRLLRDESLSDQCFFLQRRSRPVKRTGPEPSLPGGVSGGNGSPYGGQRGPFLHGIHTFHRHSTSRHGEAIVAEQACRVGPRRAEDWTNIQADSGAKMPNITENGRLRGLPGNRRRWAFTETRS